ncbi:MAG: Tim44/TimA family putative adaptor protein [Alphaproteobacteria bacterium]|nr:Tim44/TimA family putative adaptor protein [Alphaproteobacteria bacterium]
MQVDLDIVVYAVVAALLLGRLWAVLGTRREDDPQRPNPFVPPQPLAPKKEAIAQPKDRDDVIARLQPPSLPPKSVAGGLALVKEADPSFEEKPFLQEARDIFTAVVKAYADGKLSVVADFLSPTILALFQRAVDARTDQGQTAQTVIEAIREVDPVAGRAEGKRVFVSVRFISAQKNILRNKEGAVIAGSEDSAEEVTDIWTFSRDASEPNAKWIVVETRG